MVLIKYSNYVYDRVCTKKQHDDIHESYTHLILATCKSIKQYRDRYLSVGCMTCLYICLHARFEALRDRLPSMGCTCPKGE